MLKRIFKKKSKKNETDVVSTLEQLSQTLKTLEKKELLLQKKAAAEVERAKELARTKNKAAAVQCLKKKRIYEKEIEHLGNYQLRIHEQMILLESADATTETVGALRTGAATMKAMQKVTNIDDVDKIMEEINKQTDTVKQMQERLSEPVVGYDDNELLDELDGLEAELEGLEAAEELEAQLLQPAATSSAAPAVAAVAVPPAPQKHTANEVDELAALQAELAL